jgi:hypothetical protein
MSDYTVRRGCAALVTLWLVGIPPSLVWTRPIWPGAQLYAWWLVLGPCLLVLVSGGAGGLWLFYAWAALGRESDAERSARIAALERDLGIGP